MYVQLTEDFQKELLQRAIAKAGSERKLKKCTQISLGMIYCYKNLIHRLPEERFFRLLDFLRIEKESISFTLVDERDFRIKGGKAAYAKQSKSGAFASVHKKMRSASSLRMKKWHEGMRKQNKKDYFELQYSRFKKIGGYKIPTKKGDFVRNILEKTVADFLFDLELVYSYEPYFCVSNSVYFPDFVCGETIIECTSWRGESKAIALKRKIIDFEKEGYLVFVVIPRALGSFYKPIEKNILYLEELSKLGGFLGTK